MDHDDNFEDISPEPLAKHDGGIVTSAEWFKWMLANRRYYVYREILSKKHIGATEEHVKQWRKGKGANANESKVNAEWASFIWYTFVMKTSELADEDLRRRIARAYTVYKAKVEATQRLPK